MMKARIAIALCFCAAFAGAQDYGRPAILRNVGIDQRIGQQVPLDLPFADEAGRAAALRDYSGKPIILALVYYQCPSLCNMVLSGLVRSLRVLSLKPGSDFEVVAVSFDPRDRADIAAAKKASYMREFARPEDELGWHFLTGSEQASRALASAVGFRFAWDLTTNQYVHPSAIMLLTPEGKVSRYFYGIEYPSRDVRLGLVEAGRGRIGSPVDQVLLYCFHYDPSTGKYGPAIVNILRAAGILTALTLGGLIMAMLRHERRS